jgi:broad specificity phosphatase PhoE
VRAVNEDVVVVSHVSPIKAGVAWAIGAGDDVAWRLHCDVASITRIAVGRALPVLRSYNEVGHLAP